MSTHPVMYVSTGDARNNVSRFSIQLYPLTSPELSIGVRITKFLVPERDKARVGC